MPAFCHRVIDSPFGPLALVADEKGALVSLGFGMMATPFPEDAAGRTDCAARALAEFFIGARRDFHDVPLAPRGTSFQLAVWTELRRIPFAETRTYGQLAAALDKPGASRAVGRANGANPIPLVIPCHRVIGADGALTGFSAVGGVETKRALLAFERRISGRDAQSEMNFEAARATLPAAHVVAPPAAAIAHL